MSMNSAEIHLDASDIIPKLMDYVYNTSKCSNAKGGDQLQWRVTMGFRRFVALSWIMRPDAVAKDLPAWKVAEAIGIAPGSFSRICRQLSKELGGLKHPSMRSDKHCNACSESRRGVSPTTTGKRVRSTSVGVIPANRYRVSEQQGVASAIASFQAGKSWTKKQTRLLFSVGIIDADGVLTSDGIRELGCTTPPSPTPPTRCRGPLTTLTDRG